MEKKMINELKVVEQLSVYTAFYKINTSEVSQGRKGNYSLILLNSHNNTISINTYSSNQIEKATKDYLRMEKEYFNDVEMNVVLVNTGDIKKLEASYPNYFMDTKSLVRYLSEIVLDKFI